MKKITAILLGTLAIFAISCENPTENTGAMQINFQTADSDYFPIEMEIDSSADSNPSFIFFNGTEQITATSTELDDKTLRVEMPVFESYFEMNPMENGQWKGFYYDPSRGEAYRIPVYTSEKTEDWQRSEAAPQKNYAFHYGDKLEFSGYAFLELENGQLHGTIRSEIGDYRYLSGWLKDGAFRFQTFDGSHVYHWNGKLGKDGAIRGTFYSGNHFSAPFEFRPVSDVDFGDADELTRVISPIQFELPLSSSDSLAYPQERFDGKVVLIQVLGSWCPNCMDETRFIADDLYPEFHDQGFEVIGIAFERYRDAERNFAAIDKMKRDLNVEYPVVLGGFADKQEAGKVLPFLSEVISFPTTILIDQNGSIVKVHTGFDGPGTGAPYDEYVKETKALIRDLLEQ